MAPTIFQIKFPCKILRRVKENSFYRFVTKEYFKRQAVLLTLY